MQLLNLLLCPLVFGGPTPNSAYGAGANDVATTASPNTTTASPDTTTSSPDATTASADTTSASPDTTSASADVTSVSPDTTSASADTTTASADTTSAGSDWVNPNADDPFNGVANVYIFSPGQSDMEDILQSACEESSRPDTCQTSKAYVNNNGQFTDRRWAFLFKPGNYENLSVSVGFYQQVLGLGNSPSDVKFTGSGSVFCEEGSNNPSQGALDTFWRGAENFENVGGDGNISWEVSQASAIRRAKTSGGFNAAGQGYSSGGFAADMEIGGDVVFGSQQQYVIRNSNAQSIPSDTWNTVLIGTSQSGTSDPCGSHMWLEGNAAVIAAKPFITFVENKWSLVVPAMREAASGPDTGVEGATIIGFEHVYVTNEGESASSINSMLSNCSVKAVVISAGLYDLEETLKIKCAGTIVLGIGLPSLFAPADGSPAIETDDVSGVRIAGLLVDPNTGGQKTDVMIKIGSSTSSGDASAPIFLHDIYARTAVPKGSVSSQADLPSATVMVEINSQYVIGDNLWLWRADHTKVLEGASGESIPVTGGNGALDHGLVVNGDNVTMYGLFAEHALKQQVVWNGENGSTYFYQSELPYDVESDWDYPSYEVSDNVQTHKLRGGGAYCYFRDHDVQPSAAFKLPDADMARQIVTTFLNGNGGIKHVLSSPAGLEGDAATSAKQGQPQSGPASTCATDRLLSLYV